ncbi:protein takeout-like [Homalodisca vitripennis]|uniref:protein takeout-like n=1 Tax=Homalodisca vitripennis TaxID=197043 RepID=UPI001EEB3B44|nr:protein takeout-like [Homalodisca vitripennis]
MWALWGVTTAAVLAYAGAAIIKGDIEVPTYTEPCYRNKPEFNDCVKRALQGIIPKLAKVGIPELELESIDPLRVAEMAMAYDANVIAGKVILKDTVTRGIGKLKIMAVRSVANDPTRFMMEIDFYIPKMVTGGFYSMQGHVGDIPISGGDTYNITMGGVSGTWRLTGSPLAEDGQTFMRIDKFEVIPEVQALKVHANNLFKGNPELSTVTIAFVNRFWRELYEEMLPYAQESFDKTVRQILNKIFLKIPYDQLFPLAQQ